MKRMIRATEDYENNLSDAIKNAWFKALQECDLEEEDVHVLSYKDINQFQRALEGELRNRHVDLSGKSIVVDQTGEGTQIEGLKVGGNVGGIASDLIRGVIKKAWEPLSQEYWEEYLSDDSVAIYEEDKYGYCNPITSKKALQLIGSGDKTQYSGYGSQSYIDETKISVYEDYFGNLKVAVRVARYD